MEFEKSCCFTGHRPGKLKNDEESVKNDLKIAIQNAIENGCTTFITGMAPGVDVWAGQIVLKIKETNKNIKLVCAVPFNGVERNRTPQEICEFRHLILNADKVEYICPKYTRWCFSARNRWMVDNASLVIAVYNGVDVGGTKRTMDYAKQKNRKLIQLKG